MTSQMFFFRAQICVSVHVSAIKTSRQRKCKVFLFRTSAAATSQFLCSGSHRYQTVFFLFSIGLATTPVDWVCSPIPATLLHLVVLLFLKTPAWITTARRERCARRTRATRPFVCVRTPPAALPLRDSSSMWVEQSPPQPRQWTQHKLTMAVLLWNWTCRRWI